MQFYRQQHEERENPKYICGHCHHTSILPFHPKLDHTRWANFKCPHCGEPIVNNIKTELILTQSLYSNVNVF